MKPILAEIVTIGDEILYGQITDTNTQWIGAQLADIGIRPFRKTSVGDTKEAISGILAESISRADVVIFTGGLGPTKDDITKRTIADFFRATLEQNDDALEFITDFFKKRGRELSEVNRMQAFVPSNCTYLANRVGTAPGMWFFEQNTVIVSLPGVPYEMKWLMENEVLPRLKEHFETPAIVHRHVHTAGVGESFLAEIIGQWEDQLPQNLKLAYLPSFSQVRLRLTGIGDDRAMLEKQIDAEIEKVLPLISKFVFSLTQETMPEAIGRMLTERRETLSTAESCSGGYLSHLITLVPGCSEYYFGSVVGYANQVKMNELGVQQQTLLEHGAVSKQCVTEMAEGIRKKMDTTYGLAVSGIAGPNGGTPEKPVGTIWIAVATPQMTYAKKLSLTNQRLTNVQYSSYAVLNLLRLVINKQVEKHETD